jgi:hypothetical protein
LLVKKYTYGSDCMDVRLLKPALFGLHWLTKLLAKHGSIEKKVSQDKIKRIHISKKNLNENIINISKSILLKKGQIKL